MKASGSSAQRRTMSHSASSDAIRTRPSAISSANLVAASSAVRARKLEPGPRRGASAVQFVIDAAMPVLTGPGIDRKSTRLNSSTNAHLVCRLLLEKKKNKRTETSNIIQYQQHIIHQIQ